jgi:hypothetical protein
MELSGQKNLLRKIGALHPQIWSYSILLFSNDVKKLQILHLMLNK